MSERQLSEEPLTEAHLIGISRIIVRWAMTERLLMDAVWEIAIGQSFNDVADLGVSLSLVTGMDVRVKLGILRAVLHARHPEAADAFDKLVQKIERLGKVRNAIAHGRWSKGDRPGSVQTIQFLSSGRLGFRSHGFTARELNATADRIAKTTWDLADFLQAHGYWMPPKPPSESP